jgi:uncharacterized membrane protein
MNANRLSWIVFLLAAIALVGCHLYWMPQLPERIATHFDLAGKANGWSMRTDFTALWLIVPVLICVPMLVLPSVMPLLPPTTLNVPRNDYWRQPQHYPKACAIMGQWMRYFAAAVLVFLTYLDRQIFLANLATPPHIDAAASTWLLALPILFVTAMALWLIMKFARPPEQNG